MTDDCMQHTITWNLYWPIYVTAQRAVARKPRCLHRLSDLLASIIGHSYFVIVFTRVLIMIDVIVSPAPKIGQPCQNRNNTNSIMRHTEPTMFILHNSLFNPFAYILMIILKLTHVSHIRQNVHYSYHILPSKLMINNLLFSTTNSIKLLSLNLFSNWFIGTSFK